VLFAQRILSTASGTVTDPSGAVVPAADVTVTSAQTGEERKVKTDIGGVWHVFGLNPGHYNLAVEHTGFQTAVRKGVEVEVDQEAVVDIRLEIGQARERVEVESQASRLETTSGGASGMVTGSTLRDLPLNGRDLFQFTLLQPGVLPVAAAGQNPFADGGTSKAAVQGARPGMNNITLDGADINDPAYNTPPGGVAGVQLGVDAIQEYRVLLNNYSAEFGRNAGANLQMVTRSGSNEFHGSAYEFFRNSALDARNFFDLKTIPPFVRNQFGGAVGGAMARNRAFFFINYESLRESRGITQSLSVPDANAHAGLLPSAAAPSALIPVGVSPVVKPFLDLYPMPNGPELGGGLATLQVSQRQPTREDYGLLRFDQVLTHRDLLFERFVVDDSASTVPFASTAVPGFPSQRAIRNQYLMLGWQRTVSPNMLNELKFSFSRIHQVSREDFNIPLSISLSAGRPLGAVMVGALPQLGSDLVSPIDSAANTFEVIDNLSRQIGSHTLKAGGDYKRLQMNGLFDALVNGSYIFSDLTAFGFPAFSANPTLEFFLHGLPFLYLGADPAHADSDRGFRQNYLGAYIQDDWRLRPNLMLNLGLRYEYWSNPAEANGRLANIPNVAASAAPAPGRIWSSVPSGLVSPRLGFAWKPTADGKFVIRGGGGIMRDQIWANLYGDTRFYEPYYRALEYILPAFMSSPPNVASLIGFAGPPAVIGIYGVTYNPKFPWYAQYSLNVQRELGRDWLIQASYAGSHGVHLPRSGEANPQIPALGRRLNPALGSEVTVVMDAQSFYNSGQFGIGKRLSHGFSFQANYTWSKSVDDTSGALPADYISESGVAQNLPDRKGDRGRSSFDRRNAFVIDSLYEVPVSAAVTGAARTILRDWALGAVITALSGPPFTANLGSFNNSGTLALTSADRPNVKPGVNACATTGNPNQWFDPTIFTLPAPGNFGNAGRNIMCGPGLVNADISLSRRFRIGDRAALQFRSEFFNLFNHANFNVPVNTQASTGSGGNGDQIFLGARPGCNPAADPLGCGILAPNAGRITSTATTSRQIQFGLRISF
jgi:hypothetical protein